MSRISLRYSDTPLSSLDYVLTGNVSGGTQVEFNCLSCDKYFVPIVSRQQGVLLDGNKYSHKKFIHGKIDIKITTNEIFGSGINYDVNSTKLTFLKQFFCANYQYVNLSLTAGSLYTPVYIEAEELPISYINDLQFLPEINFSLYSLIKITV